MVATDHITAAAKMNPLYLPGGASVTPIQCIVFLGLLESAGNCILIDSSVLYISPIAAAPGSLYRIRQLAPTLLSTTVQVVESVESSLLRLTLSALVAVLCRSGYYQLRRVSDTLDHVLTLLPTLNKKQWRIQGVFRVSRHPPFCLGALF